MKNLTKIIIAFLLFVSVESCKKEVPKTIYGQWEIVVNDDDSFDEDLKYLYVNTDKTIDYLFSDKNNFRRLSSSNATISEDQLTYSSYFGLTIVNYVLDNDQLTFKFSNDSQVSFKRVSGKPSLGTWIVKKTIISTHPTPWNESVDIAFDGTHILYPNYTEPGVGIARINTSTFNIDSEIPTFFNPRYIAVQKSTAVDRLIFVNHSYRIEGYTEDMNINTFISDEFENYCKSMATVGGDNLWVSTHSKLYLYKFTGISHGIINTIETNRSFKGMTYVNGFLYLCSSDKIYKCQVNDGFKVLETFSIDDYYLYGITHDGSNFWLNAENNAEEMSLLKIDLN